MILVAMLGTSARAFADAKQQVSYIGIHPVAKSDGGGICYIEGPHVHMYEADKIQYRDHRGAQFFVGDPVAYGYDGPKKAYKGHHPIFWFIPNTACVQRITHIRRAVNRLEPAHNLPEFTI